MSVIDLKRFDIKNLSHDSSILIIGRRLYGKSWLLRDILYKMNIPSGIVFSGSEDVVPFYSEFIPADSRIYKDFVPQVMENVFVNQNNKLKTKLNNEKCLENSFFVVFDDIIYNKWKNDETIKTLFLNGRHYNIFNCVSLQYPKGIPPDIRNNFDYVFIFNEPSIERRKTIYSEYCYCIPTFEIFCNLMDNPPDYGCLVVRQTNSNKFEDSFFWYKAPGEFRKKISNDLKYELIEKWGIPPNIDSRPIFKKGGIHFWENWNEIENLEHF